MERSQLCSGPRDCGSHAVSHSQAGGLTAHARHPQPPFENMAPEYLSVTERWIRRKVSLHHSCLADVRSLCLPGNYEGKIRHLGNSLKNFVRLKTLDLSHNALVSVEGIQQLKMLEVLNLYYNNISSLKDVLLLCKLKALRELDLRLNPVVRSTPDYRLYLVYALPNLRKLDDCPVRDSERKASILRFPTDAMFDNGQAAAFPPGRSQRSSQPRTALVNRMVEKRFFLDDNDEAVLNLVTKGNLDPSEPLKSSTNKQPECQLYDLLEEYGNFGKDDCQNHADNFRYPKQDSPKFILHYSPEIKTKHQCATEPKVTDLGEGGCVLRTDKGPRVTFIDPVRVSQELNTSISETRARIAARGTFTPVPDPPSRATIQGGRPSQCPRPSSAPEGKSADRQESFIFDSNYGKPLASLLALVDQHWGGERSLKRNHTFLVEAVRILSGMEQVASGPGEEDKSLKANIKNLNTQRQREAEAHQSEVQGLTRQLEQARSSIEELNQHLKELLEENLSLQRQLIKSDRRLLESRMDRVPGAVEERGTAAGVRREVEELKERLQQAEKVQELADILKESNRSLLHNNKCLVAELEETRTQHRAALEQLDRRFCELSRTVSLVPETCKRKT
ncbi:centrosomal protein of 72 kDa isoform X3 [Brienomyrus brachyistius]|uniref:centrosomal protein of 72 kDa isoform X3 n=1 Tax=Brienomyrus brachyistius TaxID=42636 RepID=UPI0020B1844B|nr:centrosomal protein of 72 kDa isoform X3 [Brienomyrus brachyistius]